MSPCLSQYFRIAGPSTHALKVHMALASSNTLATILAVIVWHMFLNAKDPIVFVHLCARSGAKHDTFAPHFRSCWQQWSMTCVFGFTQPG